MAWKIRLDRTAVRGFLSNPLGPVARFIDNLTHKAETVAAQEVHVRTGETLHSIQSETHAGTSEKAIRIGEVSASYAVFFLEKGVKPHIIMSHGDYEMHRVVDESLGFHGGLVDHYFGKIVMHPGFEPKPFLTTGLWSLQDEV